MSGGGVACIGSGEEGVSEKDFFRLPGVIQKLCKDLHTVSDYFLNSFSIRLYIWLTWKEKDSRDGEVVIDQTKGHRSFSRRRLHEFASLILILQTFCQWKEKEKL